MIESSAEIDVPPILIEMDNLAPIGLAENVAESLSEPHDGKRGQLSKSKTPKFLLAAVQLTWANI